MANLSNPGFETGTAQDWTLGSGMVITSSWKFAGSYSLMATGNSLGWVYLLHKSYPAAENRTITARCMYDQGRASADQNIGGIIIRWLDASGATLLEEEGNLVTDSRDGEWHESVVTSTAPANTAAVVVGGQVNRTNNPESYFDQFSWDYDFDREIELTAPVEGATYVEGDLVPLSVNVAGTTPAVTKVEYFDGTTLLKSVSTSPYGSTVGLAVGTYNIKAVATFSDNSILTSDIHTITVEEAPEPPATREYKASNAYTYFVASDISGLTSAIPSVAKITAIEAVVDYGLEVLVRSANIGVPNPQDSNPDVIFDITDGGTLDMLMVQNNGNSWTNVGSGYSEAIPVDRADFTIIEEGVSEGKKWTVMSATESSATIGSDVDLFGSDPISMADIADKGFAFRFTPVLLPKPAYAATGDAVIRFHVNKVRVRVYFDAGSVEYYFTDGTTVIKGELASVFLEDGAFETGDASGVLQLTGNLSNEDGSSTFIGEDFTIHASYPPTDANKIGVVTADMSYNGLPSQRNVRDNRSRYVMLTANFYGDKELESIYGAHGLPRAFAYNGEFFYKIATQPDPELDQPRHVANHHGHLALGYIDGRVDISVAGKPYSFDGKLGASSWNIGGDRVTGLQELSGAILGVFGSKSVWGISGTTVDNFATQIFSPNIGATEYTVADMGFPVYANAYGVYTLAQTQQYGDYLGTPMSQDVSPWLRPRLIRDTNSDSEVVVAWPVRSKNQYRIAFSDGYVLSMTLNGATTPTFSKQKYFIAASAVTGPVFANGATFE